MGCFCHRSVSGLQEVLRRLTPDHDPESPPATPVGADSVTAAAARLAARDLPAPPWQPEPAWLDADLPTPTLTAGAIATLSGFATLRAQTRDAFGIDPLQPDQARPLARAIATLHARLAALAEAGPPVPDPAPWQRLADAAAAAERVRQAATLGLLAPGPAQQAAYAQPAGRPMRHWLPLLRRVRALAPLIATSRQLDLPEDDPAALPQRLAGAMRQLRSLPLAPPPPPSAARLMALFSAAQRLRESTGIDPVAVGQAATAEEVASRTAVAAALLRRHGGDAPDLPWCPTRLASAEVITAAAAPATRAIAGITWQVPSAASLPALHNALAAGTLARQATALLGGSPMRTAPCGSTCDAARLLRAGT